LKPNYFEGKVTGYDGGQAVREAQEI